jgi:signal transduction histidine kinase
VSGLLPPAFLRLAKLKLDQRLLYHLYLTVVSLVGILLFLWGLWQFPSYDQKQQFLLICGLAALSALLTTSVAVEKSGITYSVGPALSMAVIPAWGIGAAILLSTSFNCCLWLVKPKDQTTWKKSGAQLAFNNGFHAIAFLISGWVLTRTLPLLGEEFWLGQAVIWPLAAWIYDEVNLWLLIGILRLQQGPTIKPLEMWRQDRWASHISILVVAVGGGLLAYAIRLYQIPGILAFSVPIIVSAYAFRLYVRQMETHMKNLEDIVARRTADLAALNRQKDAYLAVLTHDMMTPLTSIQLCTEELIDDPTAAVANPHLTAVLLKSQQTLLNMVRDILDVEKLVEGQALVTQKSFCDLAHLLTHVIDIVQIDADGRGLSLAYTVDQQPLMVYADRQQLERILLNLISNAVKYTPAGGEVYAAVRSEEEQVWLEVRDTGYGIPAEELASIFDRFRRVGQLASKAPGNGLGLAITKALVEEHGGEIFVESEVGRGSLFRVRLPIGASEEGYGELPDLA